MEHAWCAAASKYHTTQKNALHWSMQVTYVLRMLLYALLPFAPSVMWVLPIEALHGITFACGWGAGTVKCKQLAPKGLAATMQARPRLCVLLLPAPSRQFFLPPALSNLLLAHLHHRIGNPMQLNALDTVVQGAFQGLYFGFGYGLGALCGGAVASKWGSQVLFAGAASTVLVGWLVGFAGRAWAYRFESRATRAADSGKSPKVTSRKSEYVQLSAVAS